MKRTIKNFTSFILGVIISISAILFFYSPVYASAYDLSDEQIEQNVEKVQGYLVVYGERVYFNYDLAEQNGESKEVLEQGLLVETISNLYNENQLTVRRLRAMSLPIWGNYCGPGYSGHDFKDPVTDILDAGCKQHDLCYKGMGYRKNCECNQALVKYIDDHYSEMSGWQMKIVAKAIKLYFSTIGNIGC